MDLDEEMKSREEGEIDSESREKGDLLPCSSPLPLLQGWPLNIGFTVIKGYCALGNLFVCSFPCNVGLRSK